MAVEEGRDALVGAWRLLEWENRAADGGSSHPMGRDPVGYLLYTSDGRFSVTISRHRRPSFASADLLGGSVDEKAAAVDGFVAYAGRYTFESGRVVHEVELSLFPNWVGTEQIRRAELSHDRLVLGAGPLLLGGKEQHARLVWERVNTSDDR